MSGRPHETRGPPFSVPCLALVGHGAVVPWQRGHLVPAPSPTARKATTVNLYAACPFDASRVEGTVVFLAENHDRAREYVARFLVDQARGNVTPPAGMFEYGSPATSVWLVARDMTHVGVVDASRRRVVD